MVRLTIISALLMSLLALPGAAAPACGGHGNRQTMLVSTEWLASHLKDPNLVILSLGDNAEYAAGHIAGALSLDYMSTHTMSTSQDQLTMELLPMEELERNFANLGVSNDSHIVLYFINSNQFSLLTRVYLTLDAMGLGAQTSILDGGVATWKAEGKPLTKEVPAVKKGSLKACPQSDVIADLSYVKGNLKHAGVDIIDARDAKYYTGDTIPNGKRAGHIPGAGNLTYSTLYDEKGKLKSPETLATMFSGAGIKQGDRVVSYCHIGQQATVVYFAARYLGYDARMFDGSWEEWSGHAELPAEVSSKK